MWCLNRYTRIFCSQIITSSWYFLSQGYCCGQNLFWSSLYSLHLLFCRLWKVLCPHFGGFKFQIAWSQGRWHQKLQGLSSRQWRRWCAGWEGSVSQPGAMPVKDQGGGIIGGHIIEGLHAKVKSSYLTLRSSGCQSSMSIAWDLVSRAHRWSGFTLKFWAGTRQSSCYGAFQVTLIFA